jgi:hypothetical protein
MEDNRKGLEAAERAGVKTIHIEPGEVEKLRGIAAEVWEETAAKSESARQTVQMLRDYLATKGIPIK